MWRQKCHELANDAIEGAHAQIEDAFKVQKLVPVSWCQLSGTTLRSRNKEEVHLPATRAYCP
eukprot:m.217876 g.217876  ORF g.217876 m.217876 type:complete len:62 (+) comp54113_c0_seq30:1393-1578(+)